MSIHAHLHEPQLANQIDAMPRHLSIYLRRRCSTLLPLEIPLSRTW